MTKRFSDFELVSVSVLSTFVVLLLLLLLRTRDL